MRNLNLDFFRFNRPKRLFLKEIPCRQVECLIIKISCLFCFLVSRLAADAIRTCQVKCSGLSQNIVNSILYIVTQRNNTHAQDSRPLIADCRTLQNDKGMTKLQMMTATNNDFPFCQINFELLLVFFLGVELFLALLIQLWTFAWTFFWGVELLLALLI